MTRYAHVIGCGMALPEKVLTNSELFQHLDLHDEWVFTRAGIHERRIANSHETTAQLAAQAALFALEQTALDPHRVQLIIVATSSPEHLFPATASIVQDRLGARDAGAFDISASSTGFLLALNLAAQAILSGSLDNAIVIGAETLSRFVNREELDTFFFGDGAGAFVLQASETPGGVLSCIMRSDGSGANLFCLSAVEGRLPSTEELVVKEKHTIHMNAREIHRFAVREMTTAAREAVSQAHLQWADIELMIPIQATKRILEATAHGLRFPMERVFTNLERYGNTCSASYGIATCEALEQNRIHPGDHLLFVGFGAGLTWGALVLQWVEHKKKLGSWHKIKRRLFSVLANLRSLIRRWLRRVEGLIWGATSKRG